jgi:hypothetical protein
LKKQPFGFGFSIFLWDVWVRRGRRIGATVGEVEEVDVNEHGEGWGEFLRVKIVLDVTPPF